MPALPGRLSPTPSFLSGHRTRASAPEARLPGSRASLFYSPLQEFLPVTALGRRCDSPVKTLGHKELTGLLLEFHIASVENTPFTIRQASPVEGKPRRKCNEINYLRGTAHPHGQSVERPGNRAFRPRS